MYTISYIQKQKLFGLGHAGDPCARETTKNPVTYTRKKKLFFLNMLCMTCYMKIQNRTPAATRWGNGFALACNRYTQDKRPFRVSNSGAVSQINTIIRPIYARDITTSCYLRSIITTILRCSVRTPGVFGTSIVVWSRTSNGTFAFSECRFQATTVFRSQTKNFFKIVFFFTPMGFYRTFFKIVLYLKDNFFVEKKIYFFKFTFRHRYAITATRYDGEHHMFNFSRL